MDDMILGLSPLWIATAILFLCYAAIMVDRVNRAVVAVLGACLAIILGILSQEQAIQGVDFNTLMLLAGMMLMVGITRRTGVFEFVAIWSAKRVRAHPGGVLALLALVTAVFSMLLDNVTTVLLIAPVTLAVTRALKVDPFPFLFSQVVASNTGGTATLIGDPPNIMIGSQAGLGMDQFLVHMAPVVVVLMLVQSAVGHFVWGRPLHAAPEDRARVMAMDAKAEIRDRPLLRRCLIVLAGVVTAFLFARRLGLEPGTIAMTGAAMLLLLDCWGKSPEEQTHHVHSSLSELEWVTLLFFAGLFVIVAGAENAGLLALLGRKLLDATGGDFATTVLAVLWVSAFVSAFIDNIPFVATMLPLLKGMAPMFGGDASLLPLWVALSLGACIGGNGTLIGASANITVAGIAERNGVRFSFMRYTRSAAGLTLLSVAICHIYIVVRYL
jgi:Na+/H+ antiporter NhaD/arsenite permease-like protein